MFFLKYPSEPYGWLLSNKEVFEHVMKLGKLPPPEECPTALGKLMEKCMDVDPAKRPTFAEVIHSKHQKH